MQYRNYGKTGIKTSLFGMGCMRLPRVYDGTDKASVDVDKAVEMIRYAADNGVNYFDTAYGYHHQTSESVLGQALEGQRRSRVHIATKQPFGVMKTQSDIRRNLENTLQKLRSDYIDVYLIHNISFEQWPEIKRREIISEYEKFKDEGLIRNIGFSYHGRYPGWKEILDYYDWDMCQVQQNLIDTDKEVTQQAIIDAGEKGCALVIMEPLRGGGLAGGPQSVREIYAAADTQRTPAQWGFRHVAAYPQVSTILSGVTTMEQLKQNIETFSDPKLAGGPLTDNDRATLAAAKQAYESVVTIPCTGCEYCLPCPHGVGIPRVFSLYNDGNMFGDFAQPQRSYSFAVNGGRDASKCAQCGACESKCPQHIEIINQLKVAHDALKGWIE